MNGPRRLSSFHALLAPLLLAWAPPPSRKEPTIVVIGPPPPEETSPEHLPVVITFPVAQDRPQPARPALFDGVGGLPILRALRSPWDAPALPYQPRFDPPPPRPSVASQHAPKTPEGERNRTRAERRKARKRKQKRGYR